MRVPSPSRSRASGNTPSSFEPWPRFAPISRSSKTWTNCDGTDPHLPSRPSQHAWMQRSPRPRAAPSVVSESTSEERRVAETRTSGFHVAGEPPQIGRRFHRADGDVIPSSARRQQPTIFHVGSRLDRIGTLDVPVVTIDCLHRAGGQTGVRKRKNDISFGRIVAQLDLRLTASTLPCVAPELAEITVGAMHGKIIRLGDEPIVRERISR